MPAEKEEASVEYTYICSDWSGSEGVFDLARKYLDELSAFVEEGIAKGYLTP